MNQNDLLTPGRHYFTIGKLSLLLFVVHLYIFFFQMIKSIDKITLHSFNIRREVF